MRGFAGFALFLRKIAKPPTALPLLFSEPFAETGLLGVWETTEAPADLLAGLASLPAEVTEVQTLLHPQKRLEFAASRLLLRHLTGRVGLPYHGLVKDEFGKPALRGLAWHLSLSHSPRYAAAVLHPTRPVGIDLEAPRDALRRVAPRILSPSELAHAGDDLHRLTVYWTAKEALYKLFGKRGLFFREQLGIRPFADTHQVLEGHILFNEEKYPCALRTRWLEGETLTVAIRC